MCIALIMMNENGPGFLQNFGNFEGKRFTDFMA